MPSRAETTGVPIEVDDLVLVLQQALEDTERYRRCADDAAAAGDEELHQFFSELADSDREVVSRATELLLPRLRP